MAITDWPLDDRPREKLEAGAAMSAPGAVRDYLRLMLHGRPHEVFVAVFLDAQHRVVAVEELFRGTLTQTSVYPREVVKQRAAFQCRRGDFCP